MTRFTGRLQLTPERIVGLDLDGVVFDFCTPFVRFVTEEGLGDGAVDHSKYSFVGKNNLFQTAEGYKKAHSAFIEAQGYSYLNVNELATETIALFSLKNIPVRYITARMGGLSPLEKAQVEQQTTQRLRDYGFYDNNLYFAENKTDVEFSILVDDNPQHVQEAQAIGRRGILFNQPYNQGIFNLRVSGWADLQNLLGLVG